MTLPTSSPAPMRTGLALVLIIAGAVLFVSGPIVGLLVGASASLHSSMGALAEQVLFIEEGAVDTRYGGTFYLYSARSESLDETTCAVALDNGKPVDVLAAPYEQNTNSGWT